MKTSKISQGGESSRYADVLLDTSFKRSFKEYGKAKRLMQLFLEALIPERKILSLEYTSEEATNQNLDKKSIRVDVECTDQNGERFVVEVQRAEQSDFYERAVYNSTFSVQRQLVSGTGVYGFSPVYFIGIMRFSLNPEDDRYLYKYSIKEEESGKIMTDNLHYVFLEVTKCKNGKSASLVEKIGYALNNMVTFSQRPDGLVGEFFDLLFSSTEISKFAEADKIKYLNDMTTERDIQNQISFAHDKGKAEGIELVAAKLKALGYPIDVMSKATGLSGEQIHNL